MTQSVVSDDQRGWRSWLCFSTWIFVLLMLPVMSHAGGKGIAPLMAILGGAGVLVSIGRVKLIPFPAWGLFLVLFMAWSFTTSFWSLYENPNMLSNPFKLGVGALLYFSAFLTLRELNARQKWQLSWMFICVGCVILAILGIDLFTNFSITKFFDPSFSQKTPRAVFIRTIKNLGHSVSTLSLLMPVIFLFLWQRCRSIRWLTFCLPIFLIGFSIKGTMAVGVVAPVFGGLAMAMAFVNPKLAIRILFGVAISFLVLAPLLSVLSTTLPETFADKLPLSWYHRVAIWEYSSELIAQKPFFGHGFDSVRTFDRTMDVRSFSDFQIMSLHPHNFGLHIWIETGLVGIVLAATSLVFFYISLQSRQSDRNYIAAVCGVGTSMCILGTVTYGVWQDWVWAIFVLTGVLINLIWHDTAKTL